MDTREKVIEFLKLSGPIIPVKLAKHLNTNILMASAFLSELTASGKVKVSHLKIGGTPLYYIPGHEYKLQNFSGNLGTKEKKAYDELASKKVVSDKLLEPLTRVSLRELKDFAVQFQFENELYWKWYLLPDSEAVVIIKNNHQQAKSDSSLQEIPAGQQTLIQQPEIIQSQSAELSNALKSEFEAINTADISQKPLPKDKPPREKKQEYISNVQQFLKENNIEISEIISKKADIECTVKILSQIGNISCYCRAKFKKSITDADLSSAFLQAQYKGMPLLFLYSGELSKKAQTMLNEYQNIIIKKLPS